MKGLGLMTVSVGCRAATEIECGGHILKETRHCARSMVYLARSPVLKVGLAVLWIK